MPCGGSWLKSSPAVPNARSRSVTTEFEIQVARDCPGDIVRHRRCADAALGADDRENPPHRLGVRRGKQSADHAHDVERAERGDLVVAHAAADELAVEHHVIVPPDHDHARAGVADFGERVETRQNVGRARLEFKDDDIRGWRGAVRLARRGHAAHLDFQMRLGQTAVFTRRLDRSRRFHGFAEGLDRDARRGRDMLIARRRVGGRVIRLGVLQSWFHHLPISLNLPRSSLR